ncbi:hypothetical protein AURDEDRAFT_122272 [Auricularia subglabra TFB-10046 SS5]|nr:hypothetical protein AURDEDRAFT_122272 [Auricularia subglabra TFB-10046 SS5]
MLQVARPELRPFGFLLPITALGSAALSNPSTALKPVCCSMASMPVLSRSDSFFEILLSDMLDCLSIENILLSAMPVNRYWREQAIHHRAYWEDLELDMDATGISVTRLSRTQSRPIHVRVWGVDLLAVIDAIAPRLPQMRTLYLNGLITATDTVLEALRGCPAPLLEDFNLIFDPEEISPELVEDPDADLDDGVVIPRDIFASHAPMLRDITLFHVGLASGDNFPLAFSSARSLEVEYHFRTAESQRVLPDISLYFPHLRSLAISRQAILESSNFRQASTWSRLERVGFNSPTLSDGQRVLSLPILGVPCLSLRCDNANDAFEVAATMKGPLVVTIPTYSITSGPFPENTYPGVRWCFRSTTDPLLLRRSVFTYLPRPAPGEFPWDTITALQHVTLTSRIVKLTLSLAEWDILVGGRYFTAFPALEVLAIDLSDRPGNSFWEVDAERAQLSCPRLQCLVFTPDDAPLSSQTLDMENVATFARDVLSDAPFPLVLELSDPRLGLLGSVADYPQLFSRLVLSERNVVDREDGTW